MVEELLVITEFRVLRFVLTQQHSLMGMTRETYFLVFYLQTFLSALIAIVSFYRFTERNTLVKLIGILFAFSFVCNVLAFLSIIFSIEGVANIPGSAYDVITVLVISVIFNHLTKSKHRVVFFTIASFYCVAALLNLFFLQKEANASYNKLAGSFIVIIYAIYYFYRLMVDLPTVHLHRLPMFWFNSAFLIYHAGTIFLFAFTNYLIENNNFALGYWIFHNTLTILQQLIILIGLNYDLRGRKAVSNT